MVASLILLIVWIVLGVPAALVAIPWTLITRDVRLLYKLGVGTMAVGLRCAGIRIRVYGRNLVPANTACLYMANHVSNLDPPLLASVQPGNSAMMVKESLMRIPVFGWALRLAHCVPVERRGRVESAKQSLRQAAEVLASGLSITIFPEGTRSETAELLPFKKGPFFLAMHTRVPVVPVTIVGTAAMMGKGKLLLRPGTADVIFHAPLDPGNFASRDALLEAVRSTIASSLPESRAEAAEVRPVVRRLAQQRVD
jgi:1-acyl-sn-glycerol-3-phosphate acyltransferase